MPLHICLIQPKDCSAFQPVRNGEIAVRTTLDMIRYIVAGCVRVCLCEEVNVVKRLGGVPPPAKAVLNSCFILGLVERMFDKIEPEAGSSRHGIKQKPRGYALTLQLLEFYAMGINLFLGGQAREWE